MLDDPDWALVISTAVLVGTLIQLFTSLSDFRESHRPAVDTLEAAKELRDEVGRRRPIERWKRRLEVRGMHTAEDRRQTRRVWAVLLSWALITAGAAVAWLAAVRAWLG